MVCNIGAISGPARPAFWPRHSKSNFPGHGWEWAMTRRIRRGQSMPMAAIHVPYVRHWKGASWTGQRAPSLWFFFPPSSGTGQSVSPIPRSVNTSFLSAKLTHLSRHYGAHRVLSSAFCVLLGALSLRASYGGLEEVYRLPLPVISISEPWGRAVATPILRRVMTFPW